MTDKLDEEIKALRKQTQEVEAAQNKGIVKALDKTISSRLPSQRKTRKGVPAAQW
jgi:hypothetical protein